MSKPAANVQGAGVSAGLVMLLAGIAIIGWSIMGGLAAYFATTVTGALA